MWPAIAITAFFLALLITAHRFRRTELQEETAALRHTVEVNLDILEAELIELTAAARTQTNVSPDAVEKATQLLRSSQTIAKNARQRLQLASNEELEKMLGLVFGAMNQSTDARRLLNACSPR
jgi:hypothetical protein